MSPGTGSGTVRGPGGAAEPEPGFRGGRSVRRILFGFVRGAGLAPLRCLACPIGSWASAGCRFLFGFVRGRIWLRFAALLARPGPGRVPVAGSCSASSGGGSGSASLPCLPDRILGECRPPVLVRLRPGPDLAPLRCLACPIGSWASAACRILSGFARRDGEPDRSPPVRTGTASLAEQGPDPASPARGAPPPRPPPCRIGCVSRAEWGMGCVPIGRATASHPAPFPPEARCGPRAHQTGTTRKSRSPESPHWSPEGSFVRRSDGDHRPPRRNPCRNCRGCR
ncbi:hypothetical protein SAMN05421854_1282 [Amycolatopsis rubida]|uniref:Uncharacterized protein n=1 Tax=Amycolatopsis rubida TaxID=112413 RepID=A0A1I6BHW5_9PSEU|nr:hypothetical protein SAMN05421854_1282 [Amycolatopsis rubida]